MTRVTLLSGVTHRERPVLLSRALYAHYDTDRYHNSTGGSIPRKGDLVAPNPLSIWARDHGLDTTDGQSKLAWALFGENSRLKEELETSKDTVAYWFALYLAEKRRTQVINKKLPVFYGGLMRCCIATLIDYQNKDGDESEGTVLHCQWCSSSMEVKDGGWHWVSPEGLDS